MSHSDEEIKDIVMKCDIKSEKIIHRRKAIKTFFIVLIVLSPVWIAVGIKYVPIADAWIKAEIYVHQNYGSGYRCIAVQPRYSAPMPFAVELSEVHMVFADKNGRTAFGITVKHGEIVKYNDRMTSKKYESFYNEYIHKLFAENSPNIEYQTSTHIEKDGDFTQVYQTYDEMVSDKEEIKSWNVSLVIRVYDKGDAQKYKWIYDYYKELRADKYQSVHIFLYFYNEDESLDGLYRGFTENFEITTDEIDRFFSK